jgi:hypothetical protein
VSGYFYFWTYTTTNFRKKVPGYFSCGEKGVGLLFLEKKVPGYFFLVGVKKEKGVGLFLFLDLHHYKFYALVKPSDCSSPLEGERILET